MTQIDRYAFSACYSLTSVVIGDGVSSISKDAFYGCDSITSFTVSAGNAAYKSVDGNLYSKDGTILVLYAVGKTATKFVVPNLVVSISESAFRLCDSLTQVILPDSVVSIESFAFQDCDSLESVVLGKSVSIGSYAFHQSDNLTKVYYRGGSTDWSALSIGNKNDNLTSATRYYYVENEADVPTDGGNYWHYGANEEIVIW